MRTMFTAFVIAVALPILVALSSAQDAPRTTEIEQLKLENATLRAQMADAQENLGRCQGQLGPLIATLNRQQAEASVKATIEKMESARPGWSYDVRTGTWAKKGATP